MSALRVVLALALLAAVAPTRIAAGDGEVTYKQICAACHRAQGQGVPGFHPPLAGQVRRFVLLPDGRRFVVRAVAHGMFGSILVENRAYNGFMPPQPQLGDAALAEVLNYVLTELSPEQLPENFAPLTAEEVASYRAPTATPSQIHSEREALLKKLGAEGSTEAPGFRPAASGEVRLAKGQAPKIRGVAQDFARNCQGCHRADGMGAPGAVPRLRAFVGHFTRLPEGRSFLVRVPGVAYAMLDDARLAAVLNWMLETYSPDELAPNFKGYTAQEVGALRRVPLADAKRTRARLVAELRRTRIIAENGGP